MNATLSLFFKSWIRSVLTLVALGAVLCVVQQAIARRHRPDVQRASGAPMQEIRALTDPTAEAEPSHVETPAAAMPKESSLASADTSIVAPAPSTPVSRAGAEAVAVSTVPSQIVAPPLARAVPSVGGGSPGNGETPMMNPPLAFTVDPKDLTPEQQTALAKIQDQFLKAIGDPNQNPDDPAYGQRWMTAQEIADQSYRAYFGWTAFSQMQLERARNTYTEIQVP